MRPRPPSSCARGVALLPRDDLGRAEAMCELGLAATAAGGGIAALEDAVEAARLVGDRRLELRAGLELARAAGVPSAELLALADDAVPVFEATGDDRALGRALLLRGTVIGAERGRNADWARAAERAAAHLARAGWPPWWCYSSIAAALFHGPVPVPRADRRCKEMLAQTPEGTVGRAELVLFLAGLTAMRGDVERRGRCSTRRTTRSTRSGSCGSRAGRRRDPRQRRAPRRERTGAAEVARPVVRRARTARGPRLARDASRAARGRARVARPGRGGASAVRLARGGRDDDLPTQFLWRRHRHGSTPPPATTPAPPGSSARRPSSSTPPTASTSGPRSRSPPPRSRPARATRTKLAPTRSGRRGCTGARRNLAALRLLGAR